MKNITDLQFKSFAKAASGATAGILPVRLRSPLSTAAARLQRASNSRLHDHKHYTNFSPCVLLPPREKNNFPHTRPRSSLGVYYCIVGAVCCACRGSNVIVDIAAFAEGGGRILQLRLVARKGKY